ncbi:MAG: acyl-CoA ligase (AMP-forming), exosortase A system-associated [Kangiellaceae bacterium]|nr:acyl-CoA ligase (AMP-forming), exosortase A system-associated [Kangiellaceae bacterium]
MYCQLDAIVTSSVRHFADKIALDDNKQQLTYAQLEQSVTHLSSAFIELGLEAGSRIGIYLPKQVEAVIATFAASRAGLVFVPINPLLKPAQVSYIAQNCNIQLLITSSQRAKSLDEVFSDCADLEHLLLVDAKPFTGNIHIYQWDSFIQAANTIQSRQAIDQDLAAILYTSGSTGQPKGVCLSHRNLIAGAQSVSHYLNNDEHDKILAVLPLSFDYGFSQVTTGLLTGATVVLMEYLLPRDVIRQVEKHQITGLAAVPPLWVQLAQLEWPESCKQTLRYITNSGGAMPKATLAALRAELPNTKPYLMYGLTEAFRSTFLEPEQVDIRPDSIGKAIPNAQILVLRDDGSECDADEAGELVHRGVHVSLGYWNAPDKTAIRFKPIAGRDDYLPELAVWSGDTVKRDNEGYLYFIGRKDDMIKCSGYRISPSELEDSLYLLDGVAEVAAIGVSDEQLGQAVMLIIKRDNGKSTSLDEQMIKKYCQQNLPNFMQPKYIEFIEQLPRNPNGKVDRKQLMQRFGEKPRKK